jgi:acyl-CoA dehydrogenase
MNTVDPDLLALFEQIFTAAEPETVPSPTGLDTALWSTLEESGLTRLTGAEVAGGSGASLADSIALIRTAAYHFARVPIGEHDLLGGWLAETTGLSRDGILTAAATTESGSAVLPWGRFADHALLLVSGSDSHRVEVRRIVDGTVTEIDNAAGEPRDLVDWTANADSAVLVGTEIAAELRLRQALLRSAQMVGAVERVVELCIEHTTVRIQFGRPLATFQAVQNLVVDIAGQARLARAALDQATATATEDWASPATHFAVAVARSVAGHATTAGIRNAHQVHGAIGTTLEHRLHELTSRLLSWRADGGSTLQWDREVGDLAQRAGTDGLWDLVTSHG